MMASEGTIRHWKKAASSQGRAMYLKLLSSYSVMLTQSLGIVDIQAVNLQKRIDFV